MGYYDDLAADAEAGLLVPTGRARRTGPEAAAEARALLAAATGGTTDEEITRVAVGRPRLDSAHQGPSPQWRIRTTPALDEAAREVAEREGIALSELVRRATAAYVQAAS